MIQRFRQAHNRRVLLWFLLFTLSGPGAFPVHGAGQNPSTGEPSQSEQLRVVLASIRAKQTEINSYVADTKAFDGNRLLNTGRFYYKHPVFARWEQFHQETKELQSVAITNDTGQLQFFPFSKTLHRWHFKWQPGGELTSLSPVSALLDSKSVVELLGIELVNGKPAYVLKAIARVKAFGNFHTETTRFYFDQQSSLLVRMVSLDERGEPFDDTRFEHFEVNVPLSDDLFKFTPPRGTEIIDELKEGTVPWLSD